MTALNALVPMVHVESVPRSTEFYRKLGFEVGNTFTPAGQTEPTWAYAPRGEFRVTDPDGYVLMVTHT